MNDSTVSYPPDPPPEPNRPPLTVPGYEILGEIARTGTAAVYCACDTVIGHDVAVAVLLPGFATAENRLRWRATVQIMARLPHPGIPPVHALGELADGSPFVVMKLIRGRDLAEILKDEPDSAAARGRLLAVFEQACQVIAFAHCQGVVHRDIKPRNVMVGPFGEILVMDWNLATPAAEAAATLVGTPAYMPPEQARGERADCRSDVFGLGGVLCHILTGRPPFAGNTAHDVIQRAAAGDLADAFARLDACGADAALIDLCKRCLSPNPADRPPDAGAVAHAVAAYRTGVEERTQTAQRNGAERALAEARRTRTWARVALAGAVILFLVTCAIAIFRN